MNSSWPKLGVGASSFTVMAQEVVSDLLRLIRLLGVRHFITLAIAAVVGDITRFANPKKFAAYLCLTPRT